MPADGDALLAQVAAGPGAGDPAGLGAVAAAYFGRAEVVETLIAAGAKLRLRDEDGTALQNAQRQSQTACVELLLKADMERGAEESIAGEEGGEEEELN